MYFKKYIIVALLVLVGSCRTTLNNSEDQSALAAANGYQLYSERPDIKKAGVKAQQHPNPEGDWNNWREGMVETLAMLYGVHRGRHIHFLARDSEFLYDMAQFFKPPPGTKVDLVNISRKNMNDPNTKKYLSQFGITEAELKKGAQNGTEHVLFDTGYDGTIPNKLRSLYTNKAGLLAQLIVSNNNSYPSTRMFWTKLADVTNATPQSLHFPKIVPYEHLPRATKRSSEFVSQGGEWVPAAPAAGAEAYYDPSEAKKYIQDIKYFVTTAEAKELFAARTKMWQKIADFVDASDFQGLSDYAQELIDNPPRGPKDLNAMRAVVLDLQEYTKHGFIDKSAAKMLAQVNLTPNPNAKKYTALVSKLGKNLKVGESYKYGKSKFLTVEKQLGKNKRGAFYLVTLQDGTVAVLNLAADDSQEVKEKFASSVDTDKALGKLKGLYPVETYFANESMVIKEYKKGESALEWMIKASAGGLDQYPEMLEDLQKVLRRTARGEIALTELDPGTLIWDGKRWIITSVIGSRLDLSKSKIKKKYIEVIESNWQQLVEAATQSAKASRVACELLTEQFK